MLFIECLMRRLNEADGLSVNRLGTTPVLTIRRARIAETDEDSSLSIRSLLSVRKILRKSRIVQ